MVSPKRAFPPEQLSVDMDIESGLYDHEAISRQHNCRYSSTAVPEKTAERNKTAEIGNIADAEEAKSPTSTVIESCSPTNSSLADLSPQPWSPLGQHPGESRDARQERITRKLTEVFVHDDITEEIKFTINSIFGRPSDDGTVWELAAMHQQSDICETPCLNNSPGGGLFGPAIAGGKIGVSWDPNQQASAEGSIRAKGAFSTHLPLTRDVEERITSLGPGLPWLHKACLWLGIAMDLGAKAGLCMQLRRFALKAHWAWFAFVLGFFALSSLANLGYFMTHYPAEPAEENFRGSRGSEGAAGQAARAAKTRARRWVRRLGMAAACLQLGTAFAATRALFTRESRQRLVDMDLRGMRLSDTIFLTLTICLLQVYIGMRCLYEGGSCIYIQQAGGFDWMLCFSIVSSLGSSALCFVCLDINDHRFSTDRWHQTELAALFCYRITELAARIALLALFANVYGFWIILVFGAHMLCTVLLQGLLPLQASRRFWAKLMTTRSIRLCCCTLRVPAFNDTGLLAACLLWPPACFVSDATDAHGRFWWRGRACGRRVACDPGLNNSLIPFPIYNTLLAAEACILLSILWAKGVPCWAQPYLGVACLLHMLWFFAALMWLAAVHLRTVNHQEDVLRRALAKQAAALQAFWPQSGRHSTLPLPEDGGSRPGSASPKLGVSGGGLPTHWVNTAPGAMGASQGYRSPARPLALSLPGNADGCKEGPATCPGNLSTQAPVAWR